MPVPITLRQCSSRAYSSAVKGRPNMNSVSSSSRPVKHRVVISALIIVAIMVSAALSVLTMPWHNRGTINPEATISLPNYYMEGMVFQRNKLLSIEGNATPGTRLTVSMDDGSRSISAQTVSDDDGTFTARLKAPAAQLAPYTFTITSGDTILFRINETYVGDVFLAAGQSNMELNYYDYYAQNSDVEDRHAPKKSELPNLVDDANIHFLITASTNSRKRLSPNDLPLRDYHNGSWLKADTTHAEYLGYLPQFFAEELRQDIPDIPIGIIQTAWGGTDISQHIEGGTIYETHIKPLRHFSLAGILWYQGENDAAFDSTAYLYSYRFTQLIDEYRQLFNEPDLPFLYVQLARNIEHANTSIIRQAQLQALDTASVSKNLALCVSIDTDKGNYRTIHPLGKEIIAHRMAEQWQAMRKKRPIPMGPLADHAVASDDRDTVTVHFKKDSADGLQSMAPFFSMSATAEVVAVPVTRPLEGFEAAGPDGVFRQASATINSNGTLTISSSTVEDIRQVRYLWESSPTASVLLYNSQHLPASPFTLKVDEKQSS